MGDQDAGEPFLGIVAGDYEGVLPSDTVSLSDSDSDDFGLADEAEVDTISPEEPSVDDGGCRSGETSDSSNSSCKSPIQPFHLRGMSSTFSLRSQSIFDCLEEAVKLSVPSMPEDNVVDGRFKRPLPPTTVSSNMVPESPGKQTKPVQAPKISAAVPDYVAHPERWTKYSLDGVSESSDKTNRAVAMEFLEGLKKRGEEQSLAAQDSYTPYFNQDPSSCGAGRIVFTKPTKRSVDGLEKKMSAGEDDKKHTKPDLRGKSPKTDDLREEDKVELEHLDGGSGKATEEEGCLMMGDLNREGKLSARFSDADEEPLVETVGFHCSKKRNRKNFRPKVDHEEEES
ncbi:U5 small nuclear ribonucleoprotein TSSC4 [Apteryx mantelli]|uniref:U5 small nuclear ribonucleoprotein TSSC4 n=1 Tax=Apteryx mantelli TaxID=2696672 RepID=A0ABM4EHD4_9AVES|nr:PREDICTED: protein TSSC4 [Apteryx mantelli mantelli]XP_013813305.1 PREDICTED: protein TSSC4 [Apteryx mantelli mantelli]XP_013813306.1 PREDICTED: protein TSSC4 [Apteryx mantelli mantelli]XP_013813307.1 PREDICTED: protein TSSC4 [Apteryx mantelli mantelli]XP_013813308.1 PREDICTED: protein TSSC4 [Apteryx mantelli mantelli]XP_025934722.1 protein TSSC4 [Apteryx rowi]XP_025934723.1 protein TSSC4 [Apteryx rowi]XP_025934724.1 protein TSSC4 [Apteryx rowi]XP_025934726.1 protein TSSC4 [Apteryx rowi]